MGQALKSSVLSSLQLLVFQAVGKNLRLQPLEPGGGEDTAVVVLRLGKSGNEDTIADIVD